MYIGINFQVLPHFSLNLIRMLLITEIKYTWYMYFIEYRRLHTYLANIFSRLVWLSFLLYSMQFTFTRLIDSIALRLNYQK